MFDFINSRKLVLSAVEASSWASEMVLNPSIIKDSINGKIHMLFRATGPCEEKRIEGKPLPFPIFLGYGWSDDDGETWSFDLEKPALSPKMEYDMNKIYVTNYKGEKVINHANGCIEDPRLFTFEEKCYVTVACRMFPPGPYWEVDEPTQCAPDWVKTDKNPFGDAASKNYTVNVLFEVDLDKLAKKEYENAFTYITSLNLPQYGEDRDVVFFPERLNINGELKIVMLQRPFNPSLYPFFDETRPSIVIAAADTFEDFKNQDLSKEILAIPKFEWESNRIGASVPPIKMGGGEWLLNYHGKQNAVVGYTQSFMILKETQTGMPQVTHRCPERLIIPQEHWEQPNRFKTPCIFITGMIKSNDELLVSYGAADEKIGVLKINYNKLIKIIKK